MLNAPISCVERPHLVLNRGYADLLDRSGFADFEVWYRFDGGEIVKDIPPRWVTRMTLTDGHLVRVFFLKRHRPERLNAFHQRSVRFMGRAVSQGMGEFEIFRAFRANGLPTVTPVAAGERRDADGRVRSFVVTEDFHPLRQLEFLIRHQSDLFEGDAGRCFKSALMRRIGRLAREMHDCGFNHKDFNATHILVDVERHPDAVDLALFDLQRVARRKTGRFRWIVKALAELNYTLPDHLFDALDRETLFTAYTGRPYPDFRDRLLRLWIRKKVDRIGRHDRKRKAAKQARLARSPSFPQKPEEGP